MVQLVGAISDALAWHGPVTLQRLGQALGHNTAAAADISMKERIQAYVHACTRSLSRSTTPQ